MNNDANEVPIIVKINPLEPGYTLKVKLKNDHKDFMKFRVVDNLIEQVMLDFIAFIRFAIYDGDYAQLYIYKNTAIE